VVECHGRLVLALGPHDLSRGLQYLAEPVHIPIQSIGDAARKLRAVQRNWALCSSLIIAAPR
jgi:23S rRNA (cytidine2498-2'-O)-methyltransferase